MRYSRVYRSGRGLRPRPVRIRALDPDRARHRRNGCLILAAVTVLACCCGGILFGLTSRVLDW